MSIRLRTVNGVRLALCAAETEPEPGDVYLDDGEHEALAEKFERDWRGQTVDWPTFGHDELAATQRVRVIHDPPQVPRWARETPKQRKRWRYHR